MLNTLTRFCILVLYCGALLNLLCGTWNDAWMALVLALLFSIDLQLGLMVQR
jgi:uncharacterized membrane protein YjjP (DUF1212 family)